MKHADLHKALDELVACYINIEYKKRELRSTGFLGGTTLLEFMNWSANMVALEKENNAPCQNDQHQ